MEHNITNEVTDLKELSTESQAKAVRDQLVGVEFCEKILRLAEARKQQDALYLNDFKGEQREKIENWCPKSGRLDRLKLKDGRFDPRMCLQIKPTDLGQFG
jgi:hypothetical protein